MKKFVPVSIGSIVFIGGTDLRDKFYTVVACGKDHPWSDFRIFESTQEGQIRELKVLSQYCASRSSAIIFTTDSGELVMQRLDFFCFPKFTSLDGTVEMLSSFEAEDFLISNDIDSFMLMPASASTRR